ncbi:uncharacterized protein BJ171DRAFT_514309 [Polychytrium aggregatum]|uniref:uncharacterized protein n=1 Tax=Polychytrium aggregatum TaxID=110093 RepID=UPI0022FE6B65|nr:uncharacterized protein BJ171DRAFT_514309 [Polychytrium aggregatum]KAI9202469.1 hypothetical protein BJ171DRAFT_514309 [Polychytrium aggregatum]
MENSFARLFRTSKYASLQPAQVITAPKSQRAVGNWGLKQALPSDLRAQYIKVQQHDDPDTKSAVVSMASDEVSSIARWKELFPAPAKQPPVSLRYTSSLVKPVTVDDGNVKKVTFQQTEAQPQRINLRRISHKEYRDLVEKARRLSPEWRKQINAGLKSSSDGVDFLNITTEVESVPVHPPVYHLDPSSAHQGRMIPIPVRGRILNRLSIQNSYSVGIAGFVAYLPTSSVAVVSQSKSEAIFYVVDVDFDHQGRHVITVNDRKPPEMRSSSSAEFLTGRIGQDPQTAAQILNLGKRPSN